MTNTEFLTACDSRLPVCEWGSSCGFRCRLIFSRGGWHRVGSNAAGEFGPWPWDDSAVGLYGTGLTIHEAYSLRVEQSRVWLAERGLFVVPENLDGTKYKVLRWTPDRRDFLMDPDGDDEAVFPDYASALIAALDVF